MGELDRGAEGQPGSGRETLTTVPRGLRHTGSQRRLSSHLLGGWKLERIDRTSEVRRDLPLRGQGSPFLAALALVAAFVPGAVAQTVGWEARWDGGLVDSSATSGDVAVGPNGNVYATGRIRNGEAHDLLTVAWNSNGNLLWYRLKDGLQGSDDAPAALVVDGDGRVVVAGTSTRSASDLVQIVVYDAAGNELWSRTHWNSTYRWNRAFGLAVGADGQVFVVVEISNGTLKKALLLSFDSIGNLLWEHERDMAPQRGAVAIDATGVLAVGGVSRVLSQDDFLIVAFDVAGSEVWARIRDGSGGRDDTVRGLIVDDNGRFLVTGTSESAAFDLDLMTVAYDIAGNELWASTTGGSNEEQVWSITADSSGNVFVTGTVGTGPTGSALTVSYDVAGKERWAVTRDNGEGSGSVAWSVTATAGDDVIIAGTSLGAMNEFRALLMKYDGDSGDAEWERIRTPVPGYAEQAVAVVSGTTGSVYMLGHSQLDFLSDLLSVAYDSSGNELWAHKEPLIPAADVPGSRSGSTGRGAIATGYDGRVYVTGTSFDGRSIDFLTVAYDASGQELWQARKSNPNDFPARAYGVAVDPSNGNVYVTGTTRSPAGYDYLTVAYDRTGAELWSRTRQGDSHGDDFACCIALHENGLVIVTGYSETGAGQGPPDILTVAYESSGNEVWSDEWGPGLGSADFARSLVVGRTGLVYVAGDTIDSEGGSALTVAYDSSGNRIWSAARSGLGGVSAKIHALAPTPDGGVAATGSTDPYGNTNIVTVVYGADGTERWAAIADSTANGDDTAAAIAVDGDGRVFVTGVSYEPDLTDPDFMTVAYDAKGSQLWSRERGGIPGGDDFANSMTIGSQGTLLVTGRSDNGTDSDMLTVAYSAGGYEMFEHRYDAGGNDEGYLALAGPDGSAFIGGVSDGAGRDFLVLQLLDESRLFADGFESGDTSSWSNSEP